MELLSALIRNPVAAAFLIILLGLLLGRVTVFRLSLGASGVLFVALAFGHCGWIDVDGAKALGDFGVVLFVYAVGLQAGGRFVRTIQAKGAAPLVIGLGVVCCGAAVSVVAGKLLGLSPAASIGVFAGALTSTPALAAATEASNDPIVPVAYGLAYPIGVVGVVLIAQLAPRLLRQTSPSASPEPSPEAREKVHQRCYLVQNIGCIGRSLGQLRLHELAHVNISRVARAGQVLPAGQDLVLQRDDIALAVGTNEQLDRLGIIIGSPVPAESEIRELPNVLARDVYITADVFAGRSLAALHVRSRYDVVITRVRRESFEFVPRGEFVLEIGDQVRIVGYEPDVLRFAGDAGIHERRLHETGMAAFAAGLVLGMLLGFTPLPLPIVGEVKLGLAGGPLFAGLALGHFGRIGRLRVYVPLAARYLMRELGLVLFLVSAGAAAGAKLLPVLQTQGVSLAIVAILAVCVSAGVGLALAVLVFREPVASALGLTCGAMTSTPGLGAASAQYESDAPALSYATVYPLALVAMTVLAQMLLALLGG